MRAMWGAPRCISSVDVQMTAPVRAAKLSRAKRLKERRTLQFSPEPSGSCRVGRRVQPNGENIMLNRLRNGVLVAVTQPADANLRTGQSVYIEGSGDGARVIPQR
jgi:hypothetical protein